MWNYILIGVISGIVFGVLDGIINANPLAQRLMAVYQPIARQSINMVAGILIDLIYGFVLAGLFLMLYNSLPGEYGFLKGLSFGLILWFLRVVMYAITQWMTITLPANAVWYIVLSGLLEMLILGALYGLTLKPWS
jgi:hypothetical protein